MKRIMRLISGMGISFLLFLTACAPSSQSGGKTIDELTAEDVDLTVMTWNIFLGRGDMEKCRRAIEEKSPDILCLQEATGAYDTLLEPFLSQNPRYAILQTEIGEYECSTPILYDTTKFDAFSYGVEVLKDSYATNGSKTLSWSAFTDRETEKSFYVLNFHGAVCMAKYEGFAGYSQAQLDRQANEWRKGNVTQLLQKRETLVRTHGDAPTFVTGDCNFNSSSEPYAMLYDAGYADAEFSAMFSVSDEGLKSTHTLGVPCIAGLTIDHIFAKGEAAFLTHEILRNEEVYDASDHCPVVAEIALLQGAVRRS